jgi:hypothetical protein
MNSVAPQPLLQQLQRLLRPLVRLAITSGVTFPVLTELLRSLFVDVASHDLLSDTGSRTDSRISLLTGVHRKEIRRLRLEAPVSQTIPPVVTIGSQIVARWLGTKDYCDSAGEPLALPRLRSEASGLSFEGLVASVTTDVRPRAVLDDFLAQDIVTLGPDDRVRLNKVAFVPASASNEQLFYFGRNLHDHIAAASANIAAGVSAPFVDSSVHYDELTPEQATELLRTAYATAEQALLTVNRAAIGVVESGGNTPARRVPTRRINFGIYIYAEDEIYAEDGAPVLDETG